MTVQTTTLAPRSHAGRMTYATLAALLLTAIVVEAVTRGAGYWQIAAFGFAPDATLFFGVGRGLVKGQLHPRAVGVYNLMHRFWGPLALLALIGFGLIPLGFVIGATTWGFHIALDRAVGYGLRTRDGFQRP